MADRSASAGAPSVRLRLFGPAREAAGTALGSFRASSVEALLAEAARRYGPDFASLLPSCALWLNGEAVAAGRTLADGDELALLPPVSGG